MFVGQITTMVPAQPNLGYDASPAPGGPGRVLVVDDTPSAREPLARLLRLSGYSVECAADGAEALDAVRQRTPDLILLDLMMPRVDGVTFLREIRKDRRFAAVPVILVTAADTPDELAAAKRLGVNDCLLKASFTVPQLLERVARTLGRAH